MSELHIAVVNCVIALLSQLLHVLSESFNA